MSHSKDYCALTLADKLIRKHEGIRKFPYKCTEGFTTIGVGRNLDVRGISLDEMELMLANDIQLCIDDLSKYEWWPTLSSARKAALLDLRFCVGGSGFRGFKRMIKAIQKGDYPLAALELLDSKFAIQTGRRAEELANIIQNDVLSN